VSRRLVEELDGSRAEEFAERRLGALRVRKRDQRPDPLAYSENIFENELATSDRSRLLRPGALGALVGPPGFAGNPCRQCPERNGTSGVDGAVRIRRSGAPLRRGSGSDAVRVCGKTACKDHVTVPGFRPVPARQAYAWEENTSP